MTPLLVPVAGGITIGHAEADWQVRLTTEGLAAKQNAREAAASWDDIAWIRLAVPLARGRWPVVRSWATQVLQGALGLWVPSAAPRIGVFVAAAGRVERFEAMSGAVGGYVPMVATNAQRVLDALVSDISVRQALADPVRIAQLIDQAS